MIFSYEEMIQRNLGFVSEDEQKVIRQARVFIPGVGGMGGAVLEVLARSGVEKFVIADIDHFEISNLNRQVFATLDTIGESKAKAAAERLLKINPQIKVEVLGREWIEKLPDILERVDIVVNGCDDHSATVQLMRVAKRAQRTVIDAFASPLPSVYVVAPDDPRPEKIFGFPTVGLEPGQWTNEILSECVLREVSYVLTHSSSHRYVLMEFAGELVRGERKRFSLAPMVWMTGVLMAYEALKHILKKPGRVPCSGVFYNPWTSTVERPLRWPFAWLKGLLVRRFLTKLSGPSKNSP